MSRSQKRAVVRGSLLLDLVTRDLLSDRQKAAALMLERDREQASGVSASICACAICASRACASALCCLMIATSSDATIRSGSTPSMSA